MPKAHFYKDDTSESTDKIKQGIVLSLDLVRVRCVALGVFWCNTTTKARREIFQKKLINSSLRKNGNTPLFFPREREFRVLEKKTKKFKKKSRFKNFGWEEEEEERHTLHTKFGINLQIYTVLHSPNSQYH